MNELHFRPLPTEHSGSGLVTQALLVAILAHAFAALVLVNLGLTSLFKRSHSA